MDSIDPKEKITMDDLATKARAALQEMDGLGQWEIIKNLSLRMDKGPWIALALCAEAFESLLCNVHPAASMQDLTREEVMFRIPLVMRSVLLVAFNFEATVLTHPKFPSNPTTPKEDLN